MAWWDAKDNTKRIPSMLNKKHKNSTKKKMSKSQKGKVRSKEHKEKISKALTGRKIPSSVRFKMSLSKINRKVSKETREKLRIAITGTKMSDEAKEKMRQRKLKNPTNYWLGKKRKLSDKWKISLKKKSDKDVCYGKKWRETKNQIILRDDCKCNNCNSSKMKLIVHHIDGNIFNLNDNNLITLCRACHLKYHIHGEGI